MGRGGKQRLADDRVRRKSEEQQYCTHGRIIDEGFQRLLEGFPRQIDPVDEEEEDREDPVGCDGRGEPARDAEQLLGACPGSRTATA